jgi:hypothetical protein
MHSNAYISQAVRRGLLHDAKAFWNTFLVRGLGLIPIIHTSSLKYADAQGAFQLLRV